ncbi:vertebrate ancient opsin-like [Solea senegalensis]|uniref:Vertebrate ancient opsin-like n=1 Tax=Solea senegalensis TaxID=28829 RepID=A0AAV6RBW3_SOLSE|nr:vertebrate ancient opsin-like [Solea senegalensis]
MDTRMFSGQDGLNYSFNLSDEQELLDTPAYRGRLSPTGFTVLSVVLGFIMTFGFLNNFVVLLLFCKFKKLRTPVNMLLLNISVSDMLVCLFGTTLSFASSVRGKWLLGRSGCSWYRVADFPGDPRLRSLQHSDRVQQTWTKLPEAPAGRRGLLAVLPVVDSAPPTGLEQLRHRGRRDKLLGVVDGSHRAVARLHNLSLHFLPGSPGPGDGLLLW